MAKRTKDEAEATRERILEGAERVFLQRGVARTTLENIACAAGVTRGAIYWHFENKAEVFDAVLGRVQQPMFASLIGLPDEQEAVPLEALRRICGCAFHLLTTDARYQRVYTIFYHRCEYAPELADSLRQRAEAVEQILRALERYFARPHNRARLRPGLTPALAARMVHVYVSGLRYDWLRAPASFDLPAHWEALLDAFFAGLVTPAPAQPAHSEPAPALPERRAIRR